MQRHIKIPTMPGGVWRTTHQASVQAILGKRAPRVISKGSQFYNRDRWTLRFFTKAMCDWAKDHPGDTPSQRDLRDWVHTANTMHPDIEPCIVIASTPDDLPVRVALALTGGAYHEAWHTLYSCRRPLRVDEIKSLVMDRWDKVEDWSKFAALLLEWSNIVEDIKIERRGIEEFPGTRTSMHDLQDFILTKEEESRRQRPEGWTKMSTLTGLFRDAGLGYVTRLSKQVRDFYKDTHPDVFEMVINGPLRPLLDEAINLPVQDDLGCLRIAMDVLIQVQEMAEEHQKKTQRPTKCPQCGAPASSLVIKIKSKSKDARIECEDCGWTQEVKLVEGEGVGTSGEGGIRVEIEDEDDQEEGASEGAGKGEEEGEGEGKGKKQDHSDEKQGEGEGEGDGEQKSSSDNPAKGPGSEESEEPPKEREEVDLEALADELEALADEGAKAGLEDVSSALGEAVEDVEKELDAKLKQGEQRWMPADQSLDVVELVPSYNRERDRAGGRMLLDSVRSEASWLLARLRVIFRVVQCSSIRHGVKKGRGISSRRLVHSYAEMRSGRFPSRPDYDVSTGFDTSVAAACVLDESGSMHGSLRQAAKCLLAISHPLDGLGCPTLLLGIRDGEYGGGHYANVGDRYHRYRGVVYDIFKGFDEPLRNALHRFVNTRATGSTPLSDGIQMGLKAMSERSETHRIVFVITDGMPNHNHTPVIRWQIRQARAAGIHLIGVGVGAEASYVKELFPDHVWTAGFSQMPSALVAKLNSLLDFRGRRRGHKVGGEFRPGRK